MAETIVPAPTHFNEDGTPPLSYIVATLLGMPHADILRGLQNGSVVPPPGAPADWLPPWASDLGTGSDSSSGDDTQASWSPNGKDQDAGANPEGIVVDRSLIRNWFNALDPGMAAATFERIWHEAGADNASRADALFGYLRRTLLGSSAGGSSAPMGQSDTDGTASAAAALTAYLAETGHRAHVVDLAGKSGSELAHLARTDIGYRYALAHLDSIALTGNRSLFASENADGALDRFDADSGEQNLTDSWITDRAKFLAWKMKADGGASASIAGNENWVFIDRASRDADGDPLKLTIAASEGAVRTNQVIFGANAADGEMLKGGTDTDRIYGGSGDDVIRGNAGNDHLEGGRGDDLVIGGRGNDELFGGRGNDDLEGGNGRDLLRGGSGDDTLTGGAGADRMVGDDGHDTYVLDPGDGADSIVDSDGDGEVQFDGAALAGGMAGGDGRYVSADGRALYSFEGDLNRSGTLTISFYSNSNPEPNDLPVNTVSIENWKNGDLGIRLGGNIDTDGSTQSGGNDAGSTADRSAGLDESDIEAPALPEIPTAGGEAVNGDLPGVGVAGAAGASAAVNDVAAEDPNIAESILPDLAVVPGSFTSGGGNLPAAFLDPDIVNRAMRSFAGVPEAPDIGMAMQQADLPAVGVTEQDVSSAMLDFHEAGDLAHDQAGNEPMPAPLAVMAADWHTDAVPTSAYLAIDLAVGKGTRQKT